MSSTAQLQQDLNTQFDLYVGLLQKHEEANKRTYELEAEANRAKSLQEQTTQTYERKLRNVREALQREEAQHAKMLKNMQDRIKQLQVKFDELHIEKQKEVAKNIQYRLRFGVDLEQDDPGSAQLDPNTMLGEQKLIRDKEVQKHVQQNLQLIDQISTLESKNAELEQRLMGDKLAFERDTLRRQEQSDKQRVNPNYRRLRFIGQAKGYDQILAWSTELDRHGLYATVRESILEEFCIFASSSSTNILKLISLNVMRHAAKSISAVNNPPIVVKALNLCGYLLSKDIGGRASKQLTDLGAVKEIVPFLDSPNENFRIESLYVIEMLAKYGDAFDFRDISMRYQVLPKVSRLLQESVHTIADQEHILKQSGALNGVQREDINASKRPLMFGAEEANSCLNIFKWYLKRHDVTKFTSTKKTNSNQKLSRAQIEAEKLRVQEELTVNIANVRGIEFISRAFCISHHNFKGERQLYRDILQMRCLALDILSRLSFTSPILAEVAYQGALDKIVWTYYHRYHKKSDLGNANKENRAKASRLKTAAGQPAEGTYDAYEPDDYMVEMHKSAVDFVNAVAKSPTINMLSAFDENDIKKLVDVTIDIYETNDALKLKIHLETLERMVNNDDKLALIMCEKGLAAQLNEIVYHISQSATDGKGRARALAYGEPVENEAGELISQAQLYLLAKKVVLRIFAVLFSKTQYDFNLNQEMPLINPFRYFTDVSIDAMVLDLGYNNNNGELEDLEQIQLAFSVVEHLVIVTQANYRESDLLAHQKLLQPAKLEAGDDIEDAEIEEKGESKSRRIPAEERYDVLEAALDFVASRDVAAGHDSDEAISGISLLCSLSHRVELIPKWPATAYETRTYLDLDLNKQFLAATDAVLATIRSTYQQPGTRGDPTGADVANQLNAMGSLSEIGLDAGSSFNASDQLLAIIMKFLVMALPKHAAMVHNYTELQKRDTAAEEGLPGGEAPYVTALERCRLVDFLNHSEGIKFIQMVIVQQSNKDYSDWILLSRVFQVTYFLAAAHSACHAVHINGYVLENIVTCVQNGYRQQNFAEMIDFFRYASFFSGREEFQPLLSQRLVIFAWLESIKQIDTDYDIQLREYYLKKKEETKRLQQMKQMADKNGNLKQSLDYASSQSKVQKPRTLAGTLLEVGGSGPYGDEEPRSPESDTRHLLAYLWDLCGLEDCQRVFIETRWSEGLGLIVSKLFPRYAIAVTKVFFSLLENKRLSNLADSHMGVSDYQELRNKGGNQKSYCDFTVPIHYMRFRKDQKTFSKGCDIMRDIGDPPETRRERLKRKLALTHAAGLGKGTSNRNKLKVDPEETRAKVKRLQRERERERGEADIRRELHELGDLSDVRSQFSGSADQPDGFGGDITSEGKQRRLPLNRNNLLKIHQMYDKETMVDQANAGHQEFLDSFLRKEGGTRPPDPVYSRQRKEPKASAAQPTYPPLQSDSQSAYSNQEPSRSTKSRRKSAAAYSEASRGSPRSVSGISLPDINDKHAEGRRAPTGGDSGSYNESSQPNPGSGYHRYVNNRKTKNGTSVKQSSSSAALAAASSQRLGQQADSSQYASASQPSRQPGNVRSDQLPGRGGKGETNADASAASLGDSSFASSSQNPYIQPSSQPKTVSSLYSSAQPPSKAKGKSLATDGQNQRKPGRDLTAVAEAPDESEDGAGSGASRLRAAARQQSPTSSDDDTQARPRDASVSTLTASQYRDEASSSTKQPRGGPQGSRTTPQRARGRN